MFTCPGQKQQGIRRAKVDGGEGAKHGNWDSHKAPGHGGTSGWEQCLEGEFGYQRGMKYVGRQRESSEVHHLLVRIAKHQSHISLISSKVGRNKNN